MNKCENCEKAYKRASFDFKQYGSYGYPYECLMSVDRTRYVRADDSCPLFREKENDE